MLKHCTGYRIHGVVAACIMLALQACSSGDTQQNGLEPPAFDIPEDAVYYQVTLTGSPSQRFTGLLEKSLKLYLLADRPPASVARLERRARGDMTRIDKALKSEGYYQASTRFEILPPAPSASDEHDQAAREAALTDPSAANISLPEPEPIKHRVVIHLEPGAQFVLSRFELQAVSADGAQALDPRTPAALPDLEELALPLHEPALAQAIVAAEGRAVNWLQNHGYPYAAHHSRRATADLENHTLDVETRFDIGPRAHFGPLTITGLTSVDEDYVRSYVPSPQAGQPTVAAGRAGLRGPYAHNLLDKLQRDLAGTGLFERVRVEPVPRDELPAETASLGRSGDATGTHETPDHDSVGVPIAVQISEAPARTIGGGLRYATDSGPGLRAFLEHRNLFGANETARVTATAALHEQGLGLDFRKPQFLRHRQALVASFSLYSLDDDAYDERAARLELGLERTISDQLRVGLGNRFEYARIRDEGRHDTALLFGLPLYARYDGSNSLLDPTSGYRTGATLTPYTGRYAGESVSFALIDTNLSAYRRLDDDARYVFAVRGRLASAFGAKRNAIPPPQRLYSGGGGSVRGYKPRFIGPLDPFGDPEGGRSVVELSTEMRLRVGANVAVVPFVDLGAVSDAVLPDLQNGVQYAAGLGLRYHTAVGPIRADVGVPINKRREDDPFQIYVSIGQAF